MTRLRIAIGLTLLLATSGVADAQLIKKVGLNNDSPLNGGFPINNDVSTPSINNLGDVVFGDSNGLYLGDLNEVSGAYNLYSLRQHGDFAPTEPTSPGGSPPSSYFAHFNHPSSGTRSPLINDTGTVAFTSYAGGLGGLGSWTINGGSALIAHQSQLLNARHNPALNPADPAYSTYQRSASNPTYHLRLNASGHSLVNGNQSTIITNAFGPTEMIASSGPPAPGTGYSFDAFYDASLSDSRQVAFVGRSGGLTGIWKTDAVGNMSLVALEGQTAPGPSPTTRIDYIYESFNQSYNPLDMNAAGDLAFTARLHDSSTGTYSYSILTDRSGTLESVVSSGDAAPTGTFTNVWNNGAAINNAGDIAFVGSTNSGDSGGVFISDSGGAVSAVLSAGQQLRTTTGSQTSFDYARSGLSLNNNGQVALLADVNVSSYALVATDPFGQSLSIVHGGETVIVDGAGKQVRTDQYGIELARQESAGTGGGAPMILNDVGEIAYKLTFTDGSRGIFVADTSHVLVDSPTGSANVHLDDGSTRWTSSVVVGGDNMGYVDQRLGTVVTTVQDAVIAREFGSQGDYTLSDAGTVWDVNGSMYIGGDQTGAGGNGLVSVQSDARLDVAGTITVHNSGELRVANALVTADTVNLNGGTLSGHGEVRGDIQGASTIVASGGTLTLGDVNSYAGFKYGGHLDVNSETVVINSRGFAELGGLTTVDGGTLQAVNGLLLGGGDVLQAGSAVNGRIAAQIGSIIDASGNLSIGDLNAFDGFFSDGILQVNSHSVTINDRNEAVLGSVTSVDGGTLSAQNGFLIEAGKNLVSNGGGTINGEIVTQGDVFVDNGILRFNDHVSGAGDFDTSVTGFVDFAGGYSPGNSPALVEQGNMTLSSSLTMEIGGMTRGSEYDGIDSSGTVMLGGILDLDLIDAGGGLFMPTIGDSFLLISGLNILGEFDGYDFSGAGLASGMWQIDVDHDLGSVMASVVTVPVPEPSTLALLGIGGLGMCGCRWRRKRKAITAT